MEDPTLGARVPTRTWWGNVALVAVAVLVLMLAGAWSRFLRPSIFDDTSSLNLAVSPGDHTIVAILEGTPRVWRSATITGIVAPRGTHVVGAWLMDAARANAELAARPGKSPTESPNTTWRDVIEFPRVGPGTALPQKVTGSRAVMLAVVWKIDNCAVVTSRNPVAGAGGGEANVPLVHWRTVLGTPYTSEASNDLGPTGPDAVGLLRSADVCP